MAWHSSALKATLLFWICFLNGLANSISIDLGSQDSIKQVSRQLADSAMKYYDGNLPGKIPGLLPGDSNWWQAGALFGQMVEYWYYTGDTTYNDITKQALLFQVGRNNAFEPENQTRVEGNDDQAFWAFAAMSAAELKFSDPNPDEPQWLALAQAVFNNQAHRWDDNDCQGGLRWQFNPINTGYTMKNTISNGCFFQLAARLARYTKNDTYAQWANKAYDWIAQSPLIDKQYQVFDSIHFNQTGCDTSPDPTQWSYNIGTLIAGSAFMYNYTNGADVWKTRLNGFFDNAQKVFFTDDYRDTKIPGGNIMLEYACEQIENCNRDQRSFKAYLSRWLAVTAQVAPFSASRIMPWLKTSAAAAMKVCVNEGGTVACGRKWYANSDDGTRDLGNQMSALGIVQGNLIPSTPAPADVETGTSVGNPSGGGIDYQPTSDDILATRKLKTADKAGGWVVTVILVAVTIGGAWFICDSD